MDRILDKINQLGVIQSYYPNIKIGKKMLSPFRDEKNPSCVLYRGKNNGDYIFRDYGGSEKMYTCIDLVMYKESCDFKTALKLIESGGYAQISNDQPLVVEKQNHKIELEYSWQWCGITKEHKEWCDKFKINIDIVYLNKMSHYSKYTVYFESGSVTIFDHTHGKPSGGIIWGIQTQKGMKFYQPNSIKSKWKSLNVEDSFIFGYDGITNLFSRNVIEEPKLVLCAGNKDTLILQSMGIYAFTLNSEVKIPDETTIQKISDLINRIGCKLNILYDWDETGIKWGKRISDILSDEFGKEKINLIPMQNILKPEYLTDTKDIGNLVERDYDYLCQLLPQILL